METRDVLNYAGTKIGILSLPDGTPEEVWTKKLAPYLVPPTPALELQYKAIDATIQARKEFCENLMGEFKKQNILDGINGAQGMWMHNRVRMWEVNMPGQSTMIVDILNMAVSGDVELATLALLYGTPDDMTQPFHWMSQAKIDWLVTRLKAYLGWP